LVEYRWIWLVVFALALSIRILCLLEVRNGPLFSYQVSDARSYAEWGQEIAAGDWWGKSRGVFYQAPLYPYLIGSVLAVGGDLEMVRWLQALMGASACLVVAWAGAVMFGWRSGLLCGLLLSLYGPAVFFDGLLHKESFGLLLLSLVLLLLGLLDRTSRSAVAWFLIGTLVALLSLLRENALVLIPILLGWAWWRGCARRAMPFLLAGLLLVFFPVALRNALVGGEWVVTTSQSGPNFFIGNHEGASGVYQPLRPGRSDTPFERIDAESIAQVQMGRELSSREVSRYWWARGLEFWRNHPSDAVVLLTKKLLLVLHPFEIADAEDLYVAREESRVLSLLRPFGLGLLLPLAVLGTVVGWPDRRIVVLLAIVVVLAGAVAFFFVMARYRFYLVPPLILLAGALIADTARDWWHSRRRLPALGLAGAALVFAAVPVTILVPLDGSMSWLNRGVALAGEGDLEAAVVDYRRALIENPNSVEANANLGSALRILGRPTEALAYLEVATALVPEDAQIQSELGATLCDLQDWSGAATVLERARRLGDTRAAVLDLLELARSRVP
jgi:4-amino-4-deoxy-L-arabinose transferase-like glycosyltransferase